MQTQKEFRILKKFFRGGGKLVACRVYDEDFYLNLPVVYPYSQYEAGHNRLIVNDLSWLNEKRDKQKQNWKSFKALGFSNQKKESFRGSHEGTPGDSISPIPKLKTKETKPVRGMTSHRENPAITKKGRDTRQGEALVRREDGSIDIMASFKRISKDKKK